MLESWACLSISPMWRLNKAVVPQTTNSSLDGGPTVRFSICWRIFSCADALIGSNSISRMDLGGALADMPVSSKNDLIWRVVSLDSGTDG